MKVAQIESQMQKTDSEMQDAIVDIKFVSEYGEPPLDKCLALFVLAHISKGSKETTDANRRPGYAELVNGDTVSISAAHWNKEDALPKDYSSMIEMIIEGLPKTAAFFEQQAAGGQLESPVKINGLNDAIIAHKARQTSSVIAGRRNFVPPALTGEGVQLGHGVS